MSIQKALAIRENMSIVPYNQNRALVPYVQDRVAGPSQNMNLFANLDFSRNKTVIKNLNIKPEMMVVLNMAKETEETMEKTKKTVDDTTSKGKSFFSSLKANAVSMGAEAIKKIGSLSLSGALETQKQLSGIQAIMGNKEVGKAYFEGLAKQADKSAYSMEEFVGVSGQFMQVTKNTDKLNALTNLSERLAMADPSQGMKGAGTAIREAMSGDFKSLGSKFGFGKADIEILKASKSLDEFTSKFDQALSKKGFTDQRLQEFNLSPDVQIKALKTNFLSGFEQIGGVVINGLMPIITALNQAFTSGQFQPFFDTLSQGFTIIADAAVWLFNNLGTGFGVVSGILQFAAALVQNFGVILLGLFPVILGIAAAMFILQIRTIAVAAVEKVVAIATQIAAGAMAAFNFVMKLNPATLVIAAIIGIITALAAFGVMTKGVKTVFADAFGFIVDLAQSAVNSVIGFINGAIRGINTVSGFFGGLLGIEAKKIEEIQFKADFSSFKESGQKFIEDFSLDNVKATFGLDKLLSPQKGPETPGTDDLLNNWNRNQKDNFEMLGDKVDNINNTVEITSEDIKLMVDLAEAESIQKNITLTPTVQVQTGDINQEVDVDSMIGKIAVALNSQAQISGSLLAEV